jgi:cytochrome c556
MLKTALLGLCVGAVGLSLLLPCYAAAPVKIATVAPIGDLTAEAEVKIKSLEDALATDKSWAEGKRTAIPTDAGVLAVLAQATVESDETAAWKAAAADVRDGAIAIATAKTYDDAKKGLATVKSAHGGTAGGAKPDHEWNKLCGLGGVMKEVQRRSTKLTRATKLKAPDEEKTAEASRDASVLAVLALAMHDDTHEVKKKDEVPEWQKIAKEFQAEMTAASAAFKKKDLAAATDAVNKGKKACGTCHDKFRPKD